MSTVEVTNCAWMMYNSLPTIWLIFILLQILASRELTSNSNSLNICEVCFNERTFPPSHDGKMKDLQVSHLHSSVASVYHASVINVSEAVLCKSTIILWIYQWTNPHPPRLTPQPTHRQQQIMYTHIHTHVAVSLNFVEGCEITNPKKKLSVSLIISHWIFYWSKSINLENFHCKTNGK